MTNQTHRFGAMLLLVTLMLLSIITTATTIQSIEYDVNAIQVGILFNQNRLMTFEPKITLTTFFSSPQLQSYLPSQQCSFYDHHTKSTVPMSTTLFDALVHHDVEFRCNSNESNNTINIAITPIVNPKASFTSETIDAMVDDYVATKDTTITEYPMVKGDMISLSLSTYIGWALRFLQWHWGELFPFPTYPTDTETLQAGNVDVGLYHFSGKTLSLAESQKLASNSQASLLSGDVGNKTPAVFGVSADWGAGTEEAQLVSHLIAKNNPEYTVNMGDLYLVGSPDEAKAHGLGIKAENATYNKAVEWLPGRLGSFWIEGNHEMYARGMGYFGEILKRMGFVDEKTKKPSGQKTSYFLLENEDWRVIFLDTGYTTYSTLIHNDENKFQPEVINWLKNVVKLDNKEDKRGVVILTHHNFMSAFSSRISSAPAEQLKELLGDRLVITMWGHEHKTAIYQPSNIGIINAFPRCMGTGGFPVDQIPIPPTARESGLMAYDNRHYDDIKGTYGSLPAGFNGYYTMNFTSNTLDINYYTIQWKDKEKKILDWDNGHLTIVERFTVNPATGDIRQLAYQVIDPEITVIDHVGRQPQLQQRLSNNAESNFTPVVEKMFTQRRQTIIGDLEKTGLDMDTYYNNNKDKRYTKPVGLNANFDEDNTKEILKQYIQQSLSEQNVENISKSLNTHDVIKMIKKGKDAVKNSMPKMMKHDDIKKVHIDYEETVMVQGHKFPKVKFE